MRLGTIILAIFLAVEAQALSCVAPDAEATFDQAAAATEVYHVAHGRLQFDGGAVPGLNGKPASVPARFEGLGLTRDGFSSPMSRRVTLDITCAGPWCGGAIAGQDVLVFLEKRADGLHLALPPCGGMAFDRPEPALLERIVTCFRAGRCGA